MRLPSAITDSPRNVALTYLAAGIIWIVVTDWLAVTVVDDPSALTTIQTVKGWVFVGGSALLIYGLVRVSRRDLEQTNERLERAMAQTSVFHRILRHNLRNQCTVILGHVGLLEEHLEEDPNGSLATIETETQRLVDMSAKSSLLKDVLVTEEETPTVEQDLAAVIDEALATIRERANQPALEVNRPAELHVEADPRLPEAFAEVLENAIEHNDPSIAPVSVRAERDGDTASVSVSDAGPGLPPVEREVLEDGDRETKLSHSEGLGLWIARTAVEASDGAFRTAESAYGGTTVTLELPLAT